METYLKCIPAIQRLIDTRKLGIDLKRRLVVIDESLHRMFISTKPGKSMEKADRKYAAFMDKVVAFMNFRLGQMGKKDYIKPDSRIDFHVVMQNNRYVDDEGNPLPAHRQVSFDIILVGKYENGEIDYKEFGYGQE